MQDQVTDEAPRGNAPAQQQASALTAEAEFRTSETASIIKDPVRLLRPARILLFLLLVMALAGAGSDALELLFFDRLETGAFATDNEMMAAAEANDLRQMVVGFAYLAVLILCFIFVGRWIYFSSKNLRAFGAAGLTIRPGWAVGWYFIPIANLWKPYQAMKEIWQASTDPLDWGRQETPGLLPAWWAIWLISNVADQASFRLLDNASTIAEFKMAATVSIASGGLNVALCAVFVTLISRISRLQIQAMEHKSTLAVFGP